MSHEDASHLIAQQQLQLLQNFWQNQLHEAEISETDFKTHQLPLARIKKVMKADEDVKMISAEAPIMFAKACEIFILELTLRAWINTEENKRRTLQKSDISVAISKTDTFDFLIDIVPREEFKTVKSVNAGDLRNMIVQDPNAYYYQQQMNPYGANQADPNMGMMYQSNPQGTYLRSPPGYVDSQNPNASYNFSRSNQ